MRDAIPFVKFYTETAVSIGQKCLNVHNFTCFNLGKGPCSSPASPSTRRWPDPSPAPGLSPQARLDPLGQAAHSRRRSPRLPQLQQETFQQLVPTAVRAASGIFRPLYGFPITEWSKIMKRNLDSLKAQKSHKPSSKATKLRHLRKNAQAFRSRPAAAVCHGVSICFACDVIYTWVASFHFHPEITASTTFRPSNVHSLSPRDTVSIAWRQRLTGFGTPITFTQPALSQAKGHGRKVRRRGGC